MKKFERPILVFSLLLSYFQFSNLFAQVHNPVNNNSDSTITFSKFKIADTVIIIKKSSGLFTNDYKTTWGVHKKCLDQLNSKAKFDGKIVKVERTGADLLFKPILSISTAKGIDTEIGIISGETLAKENRGLLAVQWEIRYDFFVQIRQHVLDQAFELVTIPRIFERREGTNGWNLRSDYQINNMPKEVDKSYKDLTTKVYQFLTDYKF